MKTKLKQIGEGYKLNNKKLSQRLSIIIILAILAFLICMQSPTNIFQQNNVDYTDSSVFKYIGSVMAKGEVPYLDTFDHKGLLLYIINYIGYTISPNIGVWLIELFFISLSTFFAYKLARKFTNKIQALFSTIISFSLISIYFEGGNLTEEYALLFQLISLNIFFDFFINPKNYLNKEINKSLKIKFNYKFFNLYIFLNGICFSEIIFLRANMISIWMVFPLMVLIFCIKRKYFSELIKFIISFLCGILFASLPLILYLIKYDALKSFIDSYFIFNMQYSQATTFLEKVASFIHFTNTPITVIALLIILIKIVIQKKNKEDYFFNLGYYIYMGVTLLLTSISGNIYNHYGMFILPMLIYPYALLFKELDTIKLRKTGINLIISFGLICFIGLPFIFQLSEKCLMDFKNRNNEPFTNEFIEYVKNNTKEDDLISVFGNSNYIYNLTNRRSASKYSYQIPIADISKEIADEYFNDLLVNKPKIIIIDINEKYINLINFMNTFLENNNYKYVKTGIYERNDKE